MLAVTHLQNRYFSPSPLSDVQIALGSAETLLESEPSRKEGMLKKGNNFLNKSSMALTRQKNLESRRHSM